MNKSLKQISNLHSYLLSLHSPQPVPSNATRSAEGVNFGASCKAMDRMDVIPKITAAGITPTSWGSHGDMIAHLI